MSQERKRCFATILYTESCVSDVIQKIEALHIPGFLSPLHDKDLKEDGEVKKPHYHLMFVFQGKKSKEQVQKIFQGLGGVGCEVIESKIGMARYLCHLDNPEKAQYLPENVICFSGADYFSVITSDIDRLRLISEMEQFCDENNCFIYSVLARYARDNRPDWHRVLTTSCTVHMMAYLKSLQYENKMRLESLKHD